MPCLLRYRLPDGVRCSGHGRESGVPFPCVHLPRSPRYGVPFPGYIRDISHTPLFLAAYRGTDPLSQVPEMGPIPFPGVPFPGWRAVATPGRYRNPFSHVNVLPGQRAAKSKARPAPVTSQTRYTPGRTCRWRAGPRAQNAVPWPCGQSRPAGRTVRAMAASWGHCRPGAHRTSGIRESSGRIPALRMCAS